jgi:choline dehydrogenase-like flavoprotein
VIVVGAGSAGCVVAASLARKGFAVTLIEAGPDRDVTDGSLAINSPDLYRAGSDLSYTQHADASWTDYSGTHSGGYPRGLGVGGSGAINGLLLHPGTRHDYDQWAALPGCNGWDSTSVWPILQRRLSAGRPHTQRGPVDQLVEQNFTSTPALFAIDANGRRACSAATDLYEVRALLNLRTTSPVQRVLIELGRATGVELVSGEVLEADLVIVSAGVLGSPKLLWQSGLDRPGIGENLHDHPSVSFVVPLDAAVPDTIPLTTVTGTIDNNLEVQLLPLNRSENPEHGNVMIGVLKQHGRGVLNEESLQLNFALDERDHAALRTAARAAQRLPHSGEINIIDPTDNDALDAWITKHPGNYLHAAGTCRMGSPTDELAVVDNNCQVIGVAGLYVVDASIFPDQPRANPYLPTLAVAELAASRIAGIVSAGS